MTIADINSKIAKLNEAIEQEEKSISSAKEKIKKLKKEIKKLNTEKDNIFANDLLACVLSDGQLSDSQRDEILELVRSARDSITSKTDEPKTYIPEEKNIVFDSSKSSNEQSDF